MVLQTGTVDWVVFDSAVLSLCLVDSYLSEQIMLEIPELIGQKNCFQCITTNLHSLQREVNKLERIDGDGTIGGSVRKKLKINHTIKKR